MKSKLTVGITPANAKFAITVAITVINYVSPQISMASSVSTSALPLASTTNATPHVSAPHASAMSSEQQAGDKTLTTSQQQLQKILRSEDFSHAKPTSKWVEKTPKPKHKTQHTTPSWWDNFWQKVGDWFKGGSKNNAEGFDMGALLGGLFKGLVLLALLGFFVWLFRYRERWLAWFSRLSQRGAKVSSANISHYLTERQQPLWHDMPPRSQLAQAVRDLLARQAWLPALSLLYRGTLREILQRHELPITKATTEQQSSWLLTKARTRTPQEAEYFNALVGVWSQVAYGQKMPHPQDSTAVQQLSERLNQLLRQWQALYESARPANAHIVNSPKQAEGVA
ncbi:MULTISPECIES: hypothetical protein [unclassified Moraxella]|uniref:hypothetical protein n=1 Tax=unclassified Moraxella TaxID=2685852 RepID=UPI003AF8B9C2